MALKLNSIGLHAFYRVEPNHPVFKHEWHSALFIAYLLKIYHFNFYGQYFIVHINFWAIRFITSKISFSSLSSQTITKTPRCLYKLQRAALKIPSTNLYCSSSTYAGRSMGILEARFGCRFNVPETTFPTPELDLMRRARVGGGKF